MFSGIIEELGEVRSLQTTGAIASLEILADKVAQDAKDGMSISINGVCLTLVCAKNKVLKFDLMQETLNCSNLRFLKPKDKVNLERALKADGRIDGHFVTGHIDTTAVITKKQKLGTDTVLEIELNKEFLSYIVLKGSVAIDGISLTVSSLSNRSFSVSLIPYTLTNTTLGARKEKDLVNIECDILGKYIHKFSKNSNRQESKITQSFLAQHGFAS